MKVILKPLQPQEFGWIVEWINAHDADFIVQWAGNTYEYPLSVEQMESHYSGGINSPDAGVFVYKIMIEGTSEAIGSIQLCKFNPARRGAVIGRFIIKEEPYRGRGIGKAALLELIRKGREQFGLERFKLNVYDINTRAVKCYESVGFRRVGYQENVYKSTAGENWGNFEMALDTI